MTQNAMTQAASIQELDFELCTGDGEPLDSERHGRQMNLFASVTAAAKHRRGEHDFYVGTDMFVYYDVEQARAIAKDPKTRKHFKGPDIFFVDKVPGRERDYWVVWEEGLRYPDVVVELLSPSTEDYDKTGKKDFYEKTFRTPEYFYYRPGADDFEGLRLKTDGYHKIRPTPEGRLWSRKLELYVGLWEGVFEGRDGKWLRLFDREGNLVLTPEEAERAAKEEERRLREDAEQRAQAAEQEVERLRALLEQR